VREVTYAGDRAYPGAGVTQARRRGLDSLAVSGRARDDFELASLGFLRAYQPLDQCAIDGRLFRTSEADGAGRNAGNEYEREGDS
jgi:hypothetical protein